MTIPNLSFFDSPRLPDADPATSKRQASSTSRAKEPPPDDLRWMRVEQWLSAKALS